MRKRHGRAALIMLLAAWLGGCEGSEGAATRPNRLAQEASPYLQMHAGNPVDWYPWGPEAFARARQTARPIFLSVGYSTCYWCHVMEREVFADPDIAARLNRDFVAIKVDREERPDVDEVYMRATQLLTRRGGWPNSVFMTPEGQPFFAGSYFPPEDSSGRPGFPSVLREIADAWEQRRDEVLSMARRVALAISDEPSVPMASELPESDELLRRARAGLASSYDRDQGGFGRGTKFPRPTYLELLLVAHQQLGDGTALEMLLHSLDAMALGGIRDHLAGGFHRYSTEPSWSIPHFEKMLYDNAQLLSLYARAFESTRRPLYSRVVAETADYLRREMRHPEGGLYSAQDAEVDAHEGASYVWSREQLVALLGEPRSRGFLGLYALTPMPDGAGHVLRIRRSTVPEDVSAWVERLDGQADARAVLLAARNRRPQPLRDDKVLTSWNGLAIRGLVEASRALERSADLELARGVADFVWARLRSEDGRLRRSYVAGQAREAAVLDDYAFLIDGLLALSDATSEGIWLERASSLADQMLAAHEDAEVGGLFMSGRERDLIVRLKPTRDGALPSGNGMALRSLRGLAERTGEARFARAADRTLSAFSALLARSPDASPGLVLALQVAGAPRPPPARLARSSPSATGSPRKSPAYPRSADHVRVSLARREASELVVRVEIDPGWHTQANPASFAYLIPTRLELPEDGGTPEVRYPPATPFRAEFAREALDVYSGRVEIAARWTQGPVPERIGVRYQACDATRCLPPSLTSLPTTP